VALGAFLGPMATGFLSGMGVTVGAAAATGISAGIGVFGSSLLAGDGFKNSLRNGLTAGALSFGVAGVTQAGGFSAPAAGAPQTLGEGFTKGLDNITSPFRKAAEFIRGGPEAAANVSAPGVGTATEQLASAPPAEAGAFGRFVEPPVDINVQQGLPAGLPQPSAPQLQPPANLGQGLPGGPGYPGGRLAGINVEQGLPSGLPDPATMSSELGRGPNFFDRAVKGAQDVYTDYLSPSRTSIQGRSADTIFKDLTLPKDQGGQFGFTSTPETLKLATEMAAKEAPGTFAKYGPLAAVAGTTLAATGGLDSLFKVPLPEGMTQEEFDAKTAEDQAQFKKDRPAFFGSFTRPEYYLPPTYRAAEGSGPEGVENFPRKNGAINGPGTGTSDDIPAMLSDGEFVFTAKSVRNMGGGSRRKGAAKMYKLMKMLEGGPVSKTAGA
jgi:hypothetical protein